MPADAWVSGHLWAAAAFRDRGAGEGRKETDRQYQSIVAGDSTLDLSFASRPRLLALRPVRRANLPRLTLPLLAQPLVLEAILEPAVAAQVYAQQGGAVATVRVAVGDAVSAGDTLAGLDPRPVQLRARPPASTWPRPRLPSS